MTDSTTIANKYLAGDLTSSGSTPGGGIHLVHKGIFLNMRSAEPAPVADYDEWLASIEAGKQAGRRAMTGVRLRRLVIMRRGGCSFAEIGKIMGTSHEQPRWWFHKLPDALK